MEQRALLAGLLALVFIGAAWVAGQKRAPRLVADAADLRVIERPGQPAVLVYFDRGEASRAFFERWGPELFAAADRNALGLQLKTPDALAAGWLLCQPDLPTLLWVLTAPDPPPPEACAGEGVLLAAAVAEEMQRNRLRALPELFVSRKRVPRSRWPEALRSLIVR